MVAGPSGVGKSSLTNLLQEEVSMETGEISKKLKRGRHTTRHAQLLTVGEHTYLMDTPGFSSLFVERMEKEELRFHYPEFAEYEGKCRFRGVCMFMSRNVRLNRQWKKEKFTDSVIKIMSAFMKS